MKLCITEKPKVAADIAKILGNGPKRDGYYDCGDWYVTWTFGHLCCLKEPHDYTELWKRWSLGQLPMIPPKFGIKLIDIDNYKRQFEVIRRLAAEAEEIVNCGDAGQEGELIQRWVMQLAGVKCPVKRLWTSSLTDEALREGFASLRPEADYRNLYLAGLSRAIGDWLLGMNATRLYSLKYSSPGNVLSIGRVQTPTLALVVKRHLEIANFKPEDYWELKTLYRSVTFNAASGRFSSEAEGREAIEKIISQPLTITSVERKKGREAPPRLFDLTSLQVEANRKWGWTADETLQLMQTLYEKKVTTYPRVDTTYLTDDIYPKVPEILRNLMPYADKTAPLLAGKLPKSKKVFDNSKVTDHHAIIPTGASLAQLQGNEKKLFHLIAMRFIAAFYPDCVFIQTNVSADVAGIPFKTSGKVIDSPGWRVLFAGQEKEEGDDKILPPFAEGESGPHEPSLLKKTTQPPKYFTEGTLLRAMETAGKTVDDEVLREALKANGIGRPSTRASIIETLFKRRYIYRDKKNIMASQAGIDLISLISDEMLKSAKLTGVWENKLRRIESGDYDSAEFIAELKQMVSDVVLNVLNDNSHRRIEVEPAKTAAAPGKAPKAPKASKPRAPRVTKIEQIRCPHCGEGHLLKGRTGYGCSRYAEGCRLVLPFGQYPADLTPGQLNKLVKKLTK